MAQRYAMSPSGLAKLAGLDPTTFNKSKRFNAEMGKERWPSTESISKALDAVGMGFEEFAQLASGRQGQGRPVPLIGMAQAGSDGFFDDAGFPTGTGWDEISFPGNDHEGAYALEVTGNSMEPVYREGDRIVVVPGQELRRGDRVVAKLTSGEVLAKELGRHTERFVELKSFNTEYEPREVPIGEIVWIARIVWASQ
jgi:phage repressor protein C with HTH and peptisase S24 domain